MSGSYTGPEVQVVLLTSDDACLNSLPLCHSDGFVSRHTSVVSDFESVYMKFRRNYCLIQSTSSPKCAHFTKTIE